MKRGTFAVLAVDGHEYLGQIDVSDEDGRHVVNARGEVRIYRPLRVISDDWYYLPVEKDKPPSVWAPSGPRGPRSILPASTFEHRDWIDIGYVRLGPAGGEVVRIHDEMWEKHAKDFADRALAARADRLNIRLPKDRREAERIKADLDAIKTGDAPPAE